MRRKAQRAEARANITKQSGYSPILRVFGVWDDRGSDEGFVHLLQVVFHLDTGEVEIRDLPPQAYRLTYALQERTADAGPAPAAAAAPMRNSQVFKYSSSIDLGSTKDSSNNRLDKSVLLLRRQRLSKLRVNMGSMYGERSDDLDCFCEDDFRVGNEVVISNRRMRICAADESTYDWFKTVKGVDMRQHACDPLSFIPTPQALAVQDQQDEWRKTREDIQRQVQYQGTYVSYGAVPEEASFANGVEVQFLISFHLGDNSMRVIMNAPPNTGVRSGLFLKRRKVLNPATSQPYKPDELHIGTKVHLPQVTLVIVSEDRLASTHNREVEMKDWSLFDAMSHLKRVLSSRGVDARQMLSGAGDQLSSAA